MTSPSRTTATATPGTRQASRAFWTVASTAAASTDSARAVALVKSPRAAAKAIPALCVDRLLNGSAMRQALAPHSSHSTEEVSMSRRRRLKLRPAPYKRRRGDARQFGRLNLVEAAAVDPALASEFVAGDTSEQGEDIGGAGGVLAQHRRQFIPRVEHEVEVAADGLRAIPDEPEGPFFIGA